MVSEDPPTQNRDRDRERSRSPDREPPKKKKKSLGKGFNFAKKPATDAEEEIDKRQYRDREEEYRPRRFGGKDDRSKNAERRKEREDAARRNDHAPPKRPAARQDEKPEDRKDGQSKKPKPVVPTSSVPYILVTVNDRLGTKTTVPCLPSDTIGDFKKLVAAQIGRAPHEIMLKRQSQRPFKDHSTWRAKQPRWEMERVLTSRSYTS